MSARKADSKASATEGRDGDVGDESLKRLGGGRWQTRDDRFTIEPQSGTWSVVDAEETDDFGLPLVRGPFKSLTDAKTAIVAARSTEPSDSPLATKREPKRAERETPRASSAGPRSADSPKRGQSRSTRPSERPTDAADDHEREPLHAARAARPESPELREPPESPKPPEPPPEPTWFKELPPAKRGRARRLIEHLSASGVADATGIVRRDLAGDVPALAAHAIEERLARLPDDTSVASVVELLSEGRDDALDVRWRLVDGDGRQILVDAGSTRQRRPTE